MYRYTCGICGTEIEGKTEESIVETTQNHLVNIHGLDNTSDVEEPNLAQKEEKIREKIQRIKD